MMENLPSSENHKIYFDYGTKTLDALYLPYQNLVSTALEYKSYNDESMMNLKKFSATNITNFFHTEKMVSP